MTSKAPPAPGPAGLAVAPGLCGACVHGQLISSPRSTFLRCGLAGQDPRFPRYPALPVRSCAGFRTGEAGGQRG